jgi:hypothetical protein
MGINLNNKVSNHIKELDKCTYLIWTSDPIYYSTHFIWWTDMRNVKHSWDLPLREKGIDKLPYINMYMYLYKLCSVR